MDYAVIATLAFVFGLVAGLFLRGSLYIETLAAAARKNLHLRWEHKISSSTSSDESKK